MTHLVDALTSVQRMLARDLAARFEDENATLEQWRVMRALANAPGLSMGEIATELEIPQPTLTRVVDSLVDSALLYRTQSAEDRRKVSVHLSTLGRRKLTRLNALADAHEQSLTADIGEQTLDRLVSSLHTLRHAEAART
ncbi:MAG TPA: MarR family transcriptional regulator [Dermatophilaceae bacterium]|nr:MarR family transcriptional regulator [Dermatophilaceae bacterium]